MPDDRAGEVLHDAPCGIATCDEKGRLLYANATLQRWIGEDRALPDTFSDLLTVPCRLLWESQIQPMLMLQNYVREIACYLKQPEGLSLPVLLNGTLRHDGAGRVVRIDFTLFDATERNSYERALRTARNEAEELAAIVRASPNAILRVDVDGRIQSCNEAARRLSGTGKQEIAGRRIEDVYRFADNETWFTDALAHITDPSGAEFEVADQTGRSFEVTISPITADEVSASWSSCSVVLHDISLRKEHERGLKLMMRELDHRVKNTLSVVNAIARQTLRREEAKGFTDRVMALARAHDLLTQAHWDSISLAQLLELVREEAGGSDCLTFAGVDVMLSPRQTTTMAMTLHELLTNAMRFGALSRPGGRVRIDYGPLPDRGDQYRISWTEEGGPAVATPNRKGFGTVMMETMMASEFDAEWTTEFAPDGLRAEFTFPHPAQRWANHTPRSHVNVH